MWFDDSPVKIKHHRRKPARRKPRNTMLEVKARAAEQRHERHHRIAAATLLLAAVTAVVIFSVIGSRALGKTLYASNDQYSLRRIAVKNLGGKLQARHIKEYAGIQEGDNLFAIRLPEVLDALESAPLIKHVTLRRSLPDTLEIEVVERSAMASVASLWAVDVEGYVLGPSARSPYLPVIVGTRTVGLRPGGRLQDPLFRQALHLLDLCDATQLNRHLRVKRIDCSDPERLDLQLVTGERVILARTRIEERLNQLVMMLAEARSSGRRTQVYDLTGDQVATGQGA